MLQQTCNSSLSLSKYMCVGTCYSCSHHHHIGGAGGRGQGACGDMPALILTRCKSPVPCHVAAPSAPSLSSCSSLYPPWSPSGQGCLSSHAPGSVVRAHTVTTLAHSQLYKKQNVAACRTTECEWKTK